MKNGKTRRKGLVAIVLVACLAFVGVAGTLAWLTFQTDPLTNVFTFGNFNDPDNKPDPADPTTPDENNQNDKDDYLFETKWDSEEEHKLMPGVAIDKNPNVGLGAGSDSAYVFIYVKNDTLDGNADIASNAPYFTIDATRWAAVDPHATEATGTLAAENAYVEGLFVYKTDAVDDASVLVSNTTGGEDVFTGELFETVTARELGEGVSYATDTNPTITVYAYLYAVDESAPESEDGSATAALTAAKAWAAKLAAPTP